jgi:hypothetical protein
MMVPGPRMVTDVRTLTGVLVMRHRPSRTPQLLRPSLILRLPRARVIPVPKCILQLPLMRSTHPHPVVTNRHVTRDMPRHRSAQSRHVMKSHTQRSQSIARATVLLIESSRAASGRLNTAMHSAGAGMGPEYPTLRLPRTWAKPCQLLV